MNKIPILLLLIIFCHAPLVHAQEKEAQNEKSADKVARELANPNSALANLRFKNQYRWYKGDLPNADEQKNYTLLFQPVLPFILKPTARGGKANLFIRPGIPVLFDQPVFDVRKADFDDVTAKDDSGSSDSALGWAVSGSTKLGLPFLGPKDSFKMTIHYGDGYGTQIKGGPKEGVFKSDSSELKTIGIFGSFGGLQHFWSERFRSNLVYGYVNSDNPGFVSGDTFESTNYFAADLIWSPFKLTSFGIEYLWGRRENENGDSGTASRYLFSTNVEF